MTRRLALAAALLTALLLPSTAQAVQTTAKLGDPPVRWGTPDNFAVTRLGSATLSRNLLHVGDVVTESLSLNNPGGQGTNGWSWYIPGGFTKVAGCGAGNLRDGTGDRTCTLKATSPTSFPDPDCGNTVGYLYGGCYHNWVVAPVIAISNGQGTGITDDYYAILPDQYAIEGRVLDVHGRPETGAAPVTITATPSQDTGKSATTDLKAHYGKLILNKDPKVRVAGPSKSYQAVNCPGALNPADGSCTVNLDHDYIDASAIDFQHVDKFALSGDVLDAAGKGVAGTTVAITGDTTDSATTDGAGHFSTDLPLGTYGVTAQPKGSEFPVPSTDCAASNLTCTVTLNQARSVKFTSCVLPDPGGKPLPTDTPDPIPGLVSTGSLEAVGCWAPDQASGTSTTKQPARLDGVDAIPVAGTTMTISSVAHTVTSDGPVTLSIGGKAISTTDHLNLDYTNSDISSDTAGGFANAGSFAGLYGLPFLFGSGITEAGPLPWATTRGSTAMTLDVGVPASLFGSYLPTVKGFDLSAPFKGALQKTTVKVAGTLTTTNRLGLNDPKVCGKLDDGVKPFTGRYGTIKNVELCYDSAAGTAAGFGQVGGGQWTGTGEIELPGKQPGIKASFGLLGYQLNQGSIAVTSLNKPIGDGLFLQSIGAGFTADLARGLTGTVTGAVGLSFGPKVKIPGASSAVDLAALNGTLAWQLNSVPELLKATGELKLFDETPIAMTIAKGYLNYNPPTDTELDDQKLDFGGALSLVDPVLAKLTGRKSALVVDVTGFYDAHRADFQATGKTSYDFPLLGHTEIAVFVTTSSRGFCLSNDLSGKPFSVGIIEHDDEKGGIDQDYSNAGCDLSKYTHTVTSTTYTPPKAPPKAAGARVTAPSHIGLPKGLRGATFAIKGRTAPPEVQLTGPGLRLRAPGQDPLVAKRAVVFRDVPRKTTYVSLFAPKRGTYHLSALKGSSPIASVLQSLPPAPPTLRKAKLGGTSCQRVLRYAYTPAAGATTQLWAVDGGHRQYLGDAKPGAQAVVFTPTQAAVGAGEVDAVQVIHGTPGAPRRLATFPTAAAGAPAGPGSLAASGHQAYWSASCGAQAYRVTVGGRQLTAAGTSLALPAALKGTVAVTVTALAADGTAGGSTTRRLHLS